MLSLLKNRNSIFKPESNCWRVSRIDQGAMLIDCADFYRAVHEAICRARHSIFIVGWEIDSECRLLRGDDEKTSEAPSVAVDLLAWKASQNPDLKIYLLRWESSVSFIGERELMPESAWTKKTPENLHFFLDETIPMGGSHHQKVILIDDELAFTGGMDIARQRWDERAHRLQEPERHDVLGSYGPYHDAQIMVTGPVVQDLAELVRWRWKLATEYEALPLQWHQFVGLVPTWPERFQPTIQNMACAIARTLPWTGKDHGVFEVRQMYLDLIQTAQNFIYIENQFMTYQEIAVALNQRLKACPSLRVLFVSSYNPQGLFEAEGMWAGRIDFKKALEEGVDPTRVKMAYPCVTQSESEKTCKRIHSKIIVVDDRYLTVGSSNLDNRSMALDTECDLTIEAQSDLEAKTIAWIRNDLIGEHTGRTAEEVEKLFASGASLNELLNEPRPFRYSLREIDDTKFTHPPLRPMATLFADPKEPLISTSRAPLRNPSQKTLAFGTAFLLLLMAVFIFFKEPFAWFNAEAITHFLETFRSSPWAFAIVCSVYIVGGFLFFPVTILSLVIAAVFGSFRGPIYAMCGALASASLMFWLGHLSGLKILRRLLGEKVRKVDSYFEKAGVIGVAAIRMLPIAPFTFVNLAAGISSVRFPVYLAGTFLGLLPGLIAKGVVGSFLLQALLNPTLKSTLYLAAGILLWLILAFCSYLLANRWKKKRVAG